MIKLHEKATRGRTKTGWLNSFHTFSFGSFNDPTRMGFGNLRVLNEDTIAPGSGFAPHDHRDMDILTIVLSGALEHKDDQGNQSRIGVGEIQLMSAGTGVRHSEFNASPAHSARFLQIWLIPDVFGGQPTYAQASIPLGQRTVLAAPQGGLVPLRSGSSVTHLRFKDGDAFEIPSDPGTLKFLHLVDGMARAEGETLSAGDALQIPAAEGIEMSWTSKGAALLFEMPLTRKEPQA